MDLTVTDAFRPMRVGMLEEMRGSSSGGNRRRLAKRGDRTHIKERMFGFTRLAARFAPGLAALSLLAATGFAMAGPADGIAIAAPDAGKTVALAVGQKLRVTLEAQPGTGFRWQPAAASTPLLSFSGTTLGRASIPGAPETQTLVFVARAPGAGKLTLVYRRAWEKNTPPAKTYSVMAKIAPQ